MKVLLMAAGGLCLLAQGSLAQDAAAGEKDFRQCRTCHSIIAEDGTEIVKGGQVGPNLWGVAGRQAGSVADFKYSDAMVAAGEAGLSWDEAQFTAYVQDPTAFLREYIHDDKARAKMTFQLRKAEEAPDLWAYLSSVGPQG